ncbi:flagellar type III secretion system pore protein FliP [Dethiosulfatarculus sandiegensis]|uniref:Flagellar biosynthetic protein FliP n=1 Tax=Dethiosulfatarculus sandiegensis TaxID=1429043 RepID=A0A0D2GF50_9BACT|nr:flagellar type III secretion system pore protein FliP [Dethiosulfatarculus sandiegensis]KIX13517.1 flagellar biosynthesis protein FliP [Dethiosulfatarculus sandiegensis]
MKRLALLALPVLLALFWVDPAWAQEGVLRLPTITMGVEEAVNPEQVSTALQIVVLLTILTLAPGILIMTTSFTRLAVVFSLLRNAMGTQQMPPAQIIVGLSLFLTFFIMAPVFNQIHETALQPYIDGKLGQEEFLKKAAGPLRSFMLKQTRQKDLGLFMKIAGEEKPKNADDVPLTSLIPAFVISELKTSFQIGFLLYVPFLVIDMVVASVLLSMGMMMLPPVMVSLPFKLMLFVLVDGWFLIVGSLVRSFA